MDLEGNMSGGPDLLGETNGSWGGGGGGGGGGGEGSEGQLHTLRYVVMPLYLLTFVFGLLGNTLTIVVVLRYKKMRNVASFFILNLAVADDLFIFSLPFMAHSTFRKHWVFGSALCKLMSAFYGINLYASIFTMVLMSVDRLLAVAWPLRSMRYRTVGKAAIVCVAVWLCCAVIMTPYWMYAHTQPLPDGAHYRCIISWPSHSLLKHLWFWTNFELLIGFIVPIIIMMLCYGLLIRHLMHNRGIFQDQSKTPIKRVTVMVSIVTIVFVICWTPYHILKYANTTNAGYYMSHNVSPTHSDRVKFAIFNTVAQALVFLSSCCNPVIYGISSQNFSEYIHHTAKRGQHSY